ncbi:hypothetical protein F0562_016584 [Nyssa sinensis]|uniref:Uncharacterized protein n=1 Tax=Nyssa sinensis TaxID=561372 RepID=A0A5J4ZG31_9ASTE|nr:hypothetical protein F0562_016584 [Nyssa sinensis]
MFITVCNRDDDFLTYNNPPHRTLKHLLKLYVTSSRKKANTETQGFGFSFLSILLLLKLTKMEGDITENLLRTAKGGVTDEKLKEKLWNETKKMWVVAGPAIFTRFSTFGINVISQAFIGHIGSTELAAFALVTTVLLRFANGILLGMASALETLCGQAYGAGQYHMLGVYLQRSWIILFICSIFLLPVFIFTGPNFESFRPGMKLLQKWQKQLHCG